MPIFLDDVDYRTFIYLVGDVIEDTAIECWNYCVMPNHYHITLRPTQPNLSMAIRQLNGRYAQWWNRRHERVGHTFQGRFKDQVVEQEGYLLALTRYVAMNPVRAGLVDRPEDWHWSSYPATIGLRPVPGFLTVAPTLRQFGDHDEPLLRTRLIDYVQGQQDDGTTDDRIRSNERILGSKGFKDAVRAARDGLTGPPGVGPDWLEKTAVPSGRGTSANMSRKNSRAVGRRPRFDPGLTPV